MNYPSYQHYPNYYQTYPNFQNQQQPITQPSSQSPMFAWVQSEEEGFNYPLNAGQSIFLMNQNEPYLYAKSVDSLGKTTFIKNKLIDESEQKTDTNYITKEELDEIINKKIKEEVDKRVSQISFKPTKSKKTVVEDEE